MTPRVRLALPLPACHCQRAVTGSNMHSSCSDLIILKDTCQDTLTMNLFFVITKENLKSVDRDRYSLA